jgi:hypothetical protein
MTTSMDRDLRYPKLILSRIVERLIQRATAGRITWRECAETTQLLNHL